MENNLFSSNKKPTAIILVETHMSNIDEYIKQYIKSFLDESY
jgi:hypothetical protein